MQTDLIRRLWDYGHFHNPAHPTGVTEADLPKLKLTDASVRTALASFQEFMAADFDRLALEEHGRIGIADGDFGPATEKLFEVERCGCPDYEMATNWTAEQAITGRGSWPAGCHPEFPKNHSFAVWFEKASMPAHWRAIFDEAWLLVRQAYADIGMAFFEAASRAKANTVVTWERSRSWIGLAIVPRGPKCGDRIWAKFDTAYASSFDRMRQVWQIARLMAHEFCHNMGLSHTRGGIMNPSIVSGPFLPNAWRGDPSESPLVRFFSGVPVDLGVPKPDEPKPDDPKPPITDEPFMFTGDFELKQGDRSFGRFILVPLPQV